MNDFKLKLAGLFLIFVTVSLLFKMDFKNQVEYAFNAFDIDISEMSSSSIEKIIRHSTEEVFNFGFYTYANPETIENEISEDKYIKLTNIIDLEKDYRAILVRGYETEESITARYYIEINSEKTLSDIKSECEEKLLNAGYKQRKNKYVKDGVEISIMNKWDCLTLIVKGL